MTDTPFRVFGPQPLDGSLGSVLYTAPTGTLKTIIRDISLTNVGATALRVKISVGDLDDGSNLVLNQDIAANTATFIRPLWLLDDGETFEGRQIAPLSPVMAQIAALSSGVDASSYTVPAWVPAAATLYFLIVNNGTASGTAALNPSSITGNGTWTLVNQTTSTVAAAKNVGVAVYWWYSSSAGSSATTVVNFASTQHSFNGAVMSITNTFSGLSPVPPWTSTATTIVQSGIAADTVAPGSTDLSITVALAAYQTGVTFYYCSKVLSTTPAPPTGYTEGREANLADATGSLAPLVNELSAITTPPASSTTVGPATFALAGTEARASVAWEVVPESYVNCMVSVIEVR